MPYQQKRKADQYKKTFIIFTILYELINHKEEGKCSTECLQNRMEVSRISFGGIPIQQLNQEDSNKLIEKALEQGINFIDTARGYSVSESLIGGALQGKRQQVFLATKSMARDKEGFKQDIETSLNNLKTDYIDLYQLHNITNLQEFEKVMAKGGALEALQEYRDKGVIKHIGITSHSVDIIEKALEYDVFETIQYPYNAVETQGSELFRKAYEKNIGIIGMKPFAGGAITNARAALKFILQNQHITCNTGNVQHRTADGQYKSN